MLYPNSVKALQALGSRIKDARLRRHFSAETVAARAGITRQTLSKIEAGNGSVTMGIIFRYWQSWVSTKICMLWHATMSSAAACKMRNCRSGNALPDELLPRSPMQNNGDQKIITAALQSLA